MLGLGFGLGLELGLGLVTQGGKHSTRRTCSPRRLGGLY